MRRTKYAKGGKNREGEKIKMGPVKNENEEERKKKKKEGATR